MDQRPRLRLGLTFLAGAVCTTPAALFLPIVLGLGRHEMGRAGILLGSGPFLTSMALVTAHSMRGLEIALAAVAIAVLIVAVDMAAVRIASDARTLTWGIAAGLAASGLFALVQVFGLGADRATGFSPHPNVFGGTIAPLWIFASGVLARTVHRRVGLVLATGALLLGGVALAYAGSRGAYLGAAAGALVLVRTWHAVGRGRLVLFWVMAIAAAALLLLPAVRAPLTARVANVSDASDVSGRTYVWALTLEAVALRPFLGHGWGAFTEAIGSVEPAFRTDRTQHAHSLYLQLLLDGGWLTVLAFGYWWLRLIRALRLRLAADPAVAGSALAAIACVAVHGLFEPLLYHGSIAVTTLLIVGIGLVPAIRVAESDSSGGEILPPVA